MAEKAECRRKGNRSLSVQIVVCCFVRFSFVRFSFARFSFVRFLFAPLAFFRLT
jgi:hypothetical protein